MPLDGGVQSVDRTSTWVIQVEVGSEHLKPGVQRLGACETAYIMAGTSPQLVSTAGNRGNLAREAAWSTDSEERVAYRPLGLEFCAEQQRLRKRG